MPGRRRGARSGRGWDAAPPRPRTAKPRAQPAETEPQDLGWTAADGPLWTGDEEHYRRAPTNRAGRDAGGAAPEEAGHVQEEPESQRSGPRRTGRGQSVGRGRSPGRATEPDEPERDTRDPAEIAREICLRQLAVRPRTRKELATALRRSGIAAEVAAEVLDRYDEVGLIDDAAFARAWVTSRHHGRGLARRALAGELRQRGVDAELVGAALEEVDRDTEAATARALVERKLRATPAGTPDAVFRRLVGLLARKGYPPGLAVNVVKAVLAARDEESAAFAEFVDPDALTDLVGESDEPIR